MKAGIILASVFLLGVGYLGYRFWQSENAVEVVRSRDNDLKVVLDGKAIREPTEVPDGENTYRGKYMTFEYPITAQIVSEKGTDAIILERVDILSRDPRLNIVAVAMVSGETRFEDIPGIKLRRSRKEEYVEKKVIVGISDCLVFTKTDGSEYAAYIFKSGRLYTLSVTAINKSVLASFWPVLLSSFSVL